LGVAVKKRFVLLAVAVVILLFPAAAYANAPVPNPFTVEIAVNGYSHIVGIEILGSNDGVHFEHVESDGYLKETRRAYEKIVDFDNNDERYKSFKLIVTFLDGKTVESNAVDFVENGSYLYDVKSNMLKEGRITSRLLGGSSVIMYALLLIIPLIVTVYVEMLISRAFRIKPGKYVEIINFITNPIMNILILLILNSVPFDYYLLVLFLEIVISVLCLEIQSLFKTKVTAVYGDSECSKLGRVFSVQ
jgi:hypothetical protein